MEKEWVLTWIIPQKPHILAAHLDTKSGHSALAETFMPNTLLTEQLKQLGGISGVAVVIAKEDKPHAHAF